MKKVNNDETQERANNEAQFIKLYHSVMQKQDFNLLQKYIICYIISYQLQGKDFYMTDETIAFHCGTSKSTVYRDLKKIKPLMNVTHKSTGGKSNNRRFLQMKNLKDWISYEVTKDIKVDVTKFKTIPEFMVWGLSIFQSQDIFLQYLTEKNLLGYFGNLKAA
ncbi:hypothetical protein [Mesoflavibacter zeaxanthinifaciens]|uniref:hypothetical protein n=1 Tax=Mesoflavibacter zeaxanthinifaciens TaxID=393060 RepID=UPI003A9236EA